MSPAGALEGDLDLGSGCGFVDFVDFVDVLAAAAFLDGWARPEVALAGVDLVAVDLEVPDFAAVDFDRDEPPLDFVEFPDGASELPAGPLTSCLRFASRPPPPPPLGVGSGAGVALGGTAPPLIP